MAVAKRKLAITLADNSNARPYSRYRNTNIWQCSGERFKELQPGAEKCYECDQQSLVNAMVETYQPQPPTLRPPVCPHCKLPMRYRTSELDKQHNNLRHVMFVCSCGLTSDQLVASAD